MADERRLGICIKGGVSLGAYEAGVLAKTLELIANNNSQSNAIPWYVDALAGASAGSMTAVATACSLLNSGPNYLWNMWVTQADITALAPQSMTGVDDGYKNGHNLLNANALDVLAGPFNSPPALKPHGALRPGAALLRMIFSLEYRWGPAAVRYAQSNSIGISPVCGQCAVRFVSRPKSTLRQRT